MEPDTSTLLGVVMMLLSILIVMWIGKQILIGLGLI